MASKAQLKGISREDLYDMVVESGIDGELVLFGVKLKTRSGEDKSLDVSYGKYQAFLLTHDKDLSGAYNTGNFDLKDAQQYLKDAMYVADLFGVVQGETEAKPISDTPVFDPRDIEIAQLKGQIAVYKQMTPNAAKTGVIYGAENDV